MHPPHDILILPAAEAMEDGEMPGSTSCSDYHKLVLQRLACSTWQPEGAGQQHCRPCETCRCECSSIAACLTRAELHLAGLRSSGSAHTVPAWNRMLHGTSACDMNCKAKGSVVLAWFT